MVPAPGAAHRGPFRLRHRGISAAAVGGRLLVSIEVKFVDTFSPKRLKYENYQDHLDASGLDEAAWKDIVAKGGSQFLRSVLLTDSLRRQGLSGGREVDRTLAVVLARSDDRSAVKVVKTIAGYQPSTPVDFWSHGDFLDACAAQPELAEWAARMRARYVMAAQRGASAG